MGGFTKIAYLLRAAPSTVRFLIHAIFNTWNYSYMNAFSIISLIEPVRYHGMRAAETGHALHVLKTVLYAKLMLNMSLHDPPLKHTPLHSR